MEMMRYKKPKRVRLSKRATAEICRQDWTIPAHRTGGVFLIVAINITSSVLFSRTNSIEYHLQVYTDYHYSDSIGMQARFAAHSRWSRNLTPSHVLHSDHKRWWHCGKCSIIHPNWNRKKLKGNDKTRLSRHFIETNKTFNLYVTLEQDKLNKRSLSISEYRRWMCMCGHGILYWFAQTQKAWPTR